MTYVPNCTCTLSPYLWSETTKHNTSLLYQGKSGIVRLASMFPLYGIEKLPSPQDGTHLPQWKDPQPLFVENPSMWAGVSVPLSTSAIISLPSTTTISSVTWTISHTKRSGTQILPPFCWYLLTSLAPLHFVAHLGGQVGGANYILHFTI